MMKWLVLDTSTASLTVGISEDGRIIGEKTHIGYRSHSTVLIPTIQKLCNELKLKLNELDGIVVGQGPGSYTGVRVGAAAAKTMAWACQLPLIAVSSLEALARSAMLEVAQANGAEKYGYFVPLFDARRENVYTGLYTKAGCLQEDALHRLPVWLEELRQLQSVKHETPEQDIPISSSMLLIGEEALKERVEAAYSKTGLTGEFFACRIQAQALAELALREWGKQAENQHYSFVPNYTQLAEVDKKLQARQKPEG